VLEPMPSEDVPADSVWQQRAKAAEDRVDAALARHPRDTSNPLGPWCPTCLVAWPCGTVLDLAGETARIDPEELAKFLEAAEERRRKPAKRDRPEDFAGRLERMVRAKVAAELHARADAGVPGTGFKRGLRAAAHHANPTTIEDAARVLQAMYEQHIAGGEA
jgi:hypothetical protein